MKYIVSISGGKDSTASLLYLLDIAKKEDVIPVFCDTKWEADETYEYLNYLENKLDIDIVRIETEGMIELARRKKFVPNRHIKTCTENLKIRPFEKWLLNNYIINISENYLTLTKTWQINSSFSRVCCHSFIS